MYNITSRRFPVTIVVVEKEQVFRTLSVCVAIVTQHTKRMRRMILSSVASLALPYFFTLFLKRRDFWKNAVNMKSVF
jgi:hypothetical protein